YGGLLVPVRIQVNAPLLLQHAVEVLRWVESVNREITLHKVPFQFASKTPASVPDGLNSSRRARTLARRCGWKRLWNDPISARSSPPGKIWGANAPERCAYAGGP